MKTTLAIDDALLKEVKDLSGAKTIKDAVKVALTEYVRRKKARHLLQLEGKIDLAYSMDELLERRRQDVPDCHFEVIAREFSLEHERLA
jgi:Arc/MetJ family transcription regulator